MAKFEKDVMEEALALNNGNVSATARALGCTRKTIYNYLHRHEDLGLVLTEARETLLDKAEEAILKLIASGDTTAIIFTLKTRGKARGWSTRHAPKRQDQLAPSFTIAPPRRIE